MSYPTDDPLSEPPPVPAADGHAHTDFRSIPPLRRRTGGEITVRVMIVIVLAILVIGGLGAVKYMQIQSVMKLAESGKFDPPPVAVNTVVVRPANWQPTIRTIGSLAAVQGVTVSADLPGVVKEIGFESGKPVKAGDVLVRLVTDQERAQLEASQAQRDLMLVSLQRSRELRDKNANSKSDFDTAEANERQAEANVANAKAAIDRKTIHAPFSGTLGIRQVNLGQYLNSGDPVVTLQAMDPIYANFTLPQQNLKDFGVGSVVEVRTDATGEQVFMGKITAINSQVDEATRNFQAQATLENKEGKLRPGMFATVDVQLAQNGNVLPVPASAINYAPYGNSVFVLTKGLIPPADPKNPKKKRTPYLGVREQFVKTAQTRGDLVAVTSGLKEGDEIVASGVFKLQANTAVEVNNSVQPKMEEKPHPDES